MNDMCSWGVEFTVPGEAQGKGRPRASRTAHGVRMFTPEKTARYENLVSLSASAAMAGMLPATGPVEMSVSIVVSPPASWSKRKRDAALSGSVMPTVKPDCDNVLKAIADACNGIVYGDDKQVVDASVRKRYGDAPHVRVTIKEAGN